MLGSADHATSPDASTASSPGVRTVCVVGAGLSGSLAALLLAQLPNTVVHVFEKRPNPLVDTAQGSSAFGSSVSAVKRSINLALSHRGIISLQACANKDIFRQCMEDAIRMPCRVIHTIGSAHETTKQQYGTKDDAIWSVSRQKLNSVLLEHMQVHPNIVVKFNHSLSSCAEDGSCTFKNGDNNLLEKSAYDLVVGADGAYSSTRDQMLRMSRINFSRTYVTHGYKELSIPSFNGEFALADHQGLHIWPRKEFMLIALPNADKSFTATLFAPFHGPDGFDNVDSSSDQAIGDYFVKYFPDVVPHMPDMVNDFRANPVGSLLTVRTSPWNHGRVVLIGDAAHAVVPFYGQGMNAGFEDALILYTILRDASWDRIEDSLSKFSTSRSASTNALADLCLEHYDDMASNTTSASYLLNKKMEAFLYWLFPSAFVPLYSMVAFSNAPYDEAVRRAAAHDKFVSRIVNTSLVVAGLGLVVGGVNMFASKLPVFGAALKN